MNDDATQSAVKIEGKQIHRVIGTSGFESKRDKSKKTRPKKKTRDVKDVRQTISNIVVIVILFSTIFTAMKAQEYNMEARNEEAKSNALTYTVQSMLDKSHTHLKDPSVRDLILFLENDTTDALPYRANFTCMNFSATLMGHALASGWRCGIVEIWFSYLWFFVKGGHIMVAFDVKQIGTVFVEPQTDEAIHPLRPGNTYMNETVKDVNVHWFGDTP